MGSDISSTNYFMIKRMSCQINMLYVYGKVHGYIVAVTEAIYYPLYRKGESQQQH